MSQLIVYINEDGGTSVIAPKESDISIHQIALKDVPTGVKFRIIERSELPEDRTFREAWEIDESLLTHGVGSPVASFPVEEGEL